MVFSEVIEVLDRGSSIDVQSTCTFESLMISKPTLERLKLHNFDKPSPVQAKAIPVGLLGRDILVQAKSGTGKTLVFSVLAVENVDVSLPFIQKVIVTPTREIAVQIKETVRKVAPVEAKSSVYVGGIPIRLNIQDLQTTKPHIVIGTTGRICQLIKEEKMNMSKCDFFVLDEADKLMDDCFRDDINFIMNSLPAVRQVAVFSATYPRNLDKLLGTFLRDAALVRFNADDVQLVNIKQYVIAKCSPVLEKLAHILSSVRYVQALVFCDKIEKCEPIATYLKSQGLDVSHVSSAMSQRERQHAVDQLRMKRVKILVSSDLTARGIDADHVNLVVNIDAAANEETYFHRIGRAARFGAHGAAITLLEDAKAISCFTALAYRGKITAKRAVLEDLPADLPNSGEYWESLPPFIDINKKSVESPGPQDNKENRVDETKSDEVPKDLPEQQGQDDETPVVEKKTFKERLAELKAARKTEKPKVETTEKSVEEKPKFKFVPTREKAKKKYYMRGELMSIRNSFSSDEWKAFAAKKHDFNSEPFLDAFSLTRTPSPVPTTSNQNQKKPTNKEKKSNYKKSPPKISKDQNLNPNPDVKSYTRGDMIKIQSAIPKKVWIDYTKTKFDTSEEPWEFDYKARLSSQERIYRQRRIEKEQRTKVIEERKKKREEDRSQLVSSGRMTHLVAEKTSSWEEYQMRWKKVFEERVGEKKAEQKVGPVVPLRDPPLIYKYRVDMYKRRLQEQDAYLQHEIELENKKIQEMEVQTDEVVEKMNELQIVDEVAPAKVSEKETEELEKEDEEFDDEEYWDEDEEYWDEEEEYIDEEELPAEESAQIPQFEELGAGFIRNVNYQAATQSYMVLMNAAFSKYRK